MKLVYWDRQWLIDAFTEAFRRRGDTSFSSNYIAVEGSDGVGKGEFHIRLMSNGRAVRTGGTWPMLGGRAYAQLASFRPQNLDDLKERILRGPNVKGVPYVLLGRAVVDSGEAMVTARIIRVQTAIAIASDQQIGPAKSAYDRAVLAEALVTKLLDSLRRQSKHV